MNDTRSMVMSILTQFRDNQRRIEMLRYELEHPATVTADDMIDALSFGHGEQVGTSSGHISNKTLYIALNYQDKMTLTNNEIIHGISVQLAKLENQQQRLIHYIGLMDEKDAEVIRMTYMDGMDTDQIAAQTGVSVRTVRTRRANAINHLCAMFEYTLMLHPDKANE